MTQPDIPDDFPKPDQDGETVDMRGSQGPIYKPRGPVTQHFGPEINATHQDAQVNGAGAVAQGDRAVAASAGGVAVAASEGAQVSITVHKEELGAEQPITPDAIARHRAALRERLEAHACARWGGMPKYIQEEGAMLPIEASPYHTGRLGSRQNLLQLLHSANRLLVLGEPGSGKTVSLERLAWELCAPPDPTEPDREPAVPVLVRLLHYEGKPLAEWLRAFLQETGYLRFDDQQSLVAFLKGEATARCFFLFDGLNEVSPSYRDPLVGELVRWMAAYPRHPVVLTSRAQDELWRRLRGEVGQTVVVQPIADEQARDYLVAHLGQRGGELYGRLDERLRAMARTPLILWLTKEAGTAGESIPGNRGKLYARFVSRMLRRDTDRRMDAEIPERVKRRALVVLAYHLGQSQRLSCPRDEAVAVVARRLGDKLAEYVVGACARHGLLAGEDTVWFAPHQTVQEHFAALALREVAQREWRMGGWARLRRSARQMLSGKEEELATLAAEDWWMETFVQLAGLVDEADRLALDVARVNPWLAWWCVEEGRGVTEETQEAVADRSIRLLESDRVADRRRAVAALARMRSKRIMRPLLRAAADSDPDVTGLAVQALVEMGDAVRPEVGAALETGDQHLRVAALRYLRTRPNDMLWAEIPEVMWNELLETDDRRRAVAALARIPGGRAVPSLLRAAADSDAEVAGLAVQGLLGMSEAARMMVEEALRGADRRSRLGALRYLIEQPDDRLAQPLFQVAANADAEVAELAVQGLLGMSETARPAAEETLRGADRRLHLGALRYLIEQPDDRLAQPLFQMAANADAEVAELAVQALVEMGETVRAQALALAQQPEQSLHRSGLAYLEALLGLPVVWVPPGLFLMGTEEQDIPALLERFGGEREWYERETPQHKVTLPGYWIGRYPVTVAQFRAFVEASGHKPADPDSLKGPDDHPVVYVTWYEALAFCRWLREKTGLQVMLPSEAEWEKAARGGKQIPNPKSQGPSWAENPAPARLYPWGDDPPDESRCNFNMNTGETTSVCRYSPQGDSPYGCADMAGNVWEWTRSLYRKYPYDPGGGREDLEAGGEVRRVLRGGGAFYIEAWNVRCASRLWLNPSARLRYFGFRVCVVSQ
jgi:formylglycine-generating enzyme required for sulfatase activity